MAASSLDRKRLHKLIDELPDEVLDQVYDGFTAVLIDLIEKQVCVGPEDGSYTVKTEE